MEQRFSHVHRISPRDQLIPSSSAVSLLLSLKIMSRDRAPRVFLGRLPRDIKEKDVERFFRGFGRIREINLKNGFGFVEFQDYKDADDAVYEMNHKELMGERITVEHARPTSRSGGSGGGGGGGGRDGGRDGGSGMRRSGGFRFRDRYGAPYNTEFKITVENLSSRASWQLQSVVVIYFVGAWFRKKSIPDFFPGLNQKREILWLWQKYGTWLASQG